MDAMQKPEVVVAAAAFIAATGTAIYVSKQDTVPRSEYVDSVKAIGTCSTTIDKCQKVVKKHSLSIGELQDEIASLHEYNDRLVDTINSIINTLEEKGISVILEPEHKQPTVTATPRRDTRKIVQGRHKEAERQNPGRGDNGRGDNGRGDNGRGDNGRGDNGRGGGRQTNRGTDRKFVRRDDSLSEDSDDEAAEDDDSWDETMNQLRTRNQRMGEQLKRR